MAASQDQLNGNLNWIGITLQWWYNGGCTTELAAEYGVPVAGVNWKTDNFNSSAGQDCAHAIGYTNAVFEDDNFCPHRCTTSSTRTTSLGMATAAPRMTSAEALLPTARVRDRTSERADVVGLLG